MVQIYSRAIARANMRVLHVAQALSRNFGGTQSVLLDIVKAQRALGLRVDVVSTNVDAPSGVLPVQTNQFIDQGGIRFRYSTVQFRPLLFSTDLKRYLERSVREYDVVHVHGLYRFPVTYAAYQARLQHVPYVISLHGALDPYLYRKSSRSVWLKRLYERSFDLPNLHAAGAIHYTAQEEEERASFLKLRAPSFVVPNGLDWSSYESLPARGGFRERLGIGDAPMALFLGRLHFKKGLDLLIPAFAQLQAKMPAAHLVIVGPDNDGYGINVRRWVSERKLQNAVHFTGPLYGSDIVQAYTDADVFVLSSYTENFGMTVVEAMACGVPVVISNQVNIHREVSGAAAGLVTNCEVGEIATALARVLQSPNERRSMGQAGRALVRRQYTWPSITKALVHEYEMVIQRHSARMVAAP